MVFLQHARLLALDFAGSALGQSSSSSEALLSRGIEALGGKDNLESVRDVVYLGGEYV